MINEKTKYIAQCLELAILFEVSANKPGNVNLLIGFEGTKYEHFISSAVAAYPFFEQAAEKGNRIFLKELNANKVRIGKIIKNCISAINYWQTGGNTLLGTIILLMPIATAAGMLNIKSNQKINLLKLREKIKIVVETTTPEDAVEVYKGINIANPSGLNKVPELDVNDPVSTKNILEKNISLYEIFKIASKYDNICSEWVLNYPITFDVAYPYLINQIKKKKDLNTSIINTFLEVISKYPDTLIARKVGIKKALKISNMAKEILDSGGIETSSGRKRLSNLDQKLRSSSNLLNPGTTADIIAGAIALTVLNGYKP